MKKLTLVLIYFGYLNFIQAQTFVNINYAYDNAGNRISRNRTSTLNKKGSGDTLNFINSSIPDDNKHQSESVNIKTYIVIYPNPVSHKLNVKLHLNNEVNLNQYSLIDMFGRVVLTHESFRQEETIDISGLADGVYFLHVKSGNNEIIHRINKIRK